MEEQANPVGRPTVMTEEVLRKLELAFSYGCSDLEACLFAGISKTPFYDYQDEHPEFKERKELLKDTPVLQARETVVRELKSNLQAAQWYLERKRNKEFSTRTEQEQNGTLKHVIEIHDWRGATKQIDNFNQDGTFKESLTPTIMPPVEADQSLEQPKVDETAETPMATPTHESPVEGAPMDQIA